MTAGPDYRKAINAVLREYLDARSEHDDVDANAIVERLASDAARNQARMAEAFLERRLREAVSRGDELGKTITRLKREYN